MASDRLSKTDALKRLRDCLENGIVEYHDHFEKRCRERGIDLQDAQRALQKGMIYREPELDVRFQEWSTGLIGQHPKVKPLHSSLRSLKRTRPWRSLH